MKSAPIFYKPKKKSIIFDVFPISRHRRHHLVWALFCVPYVSLSVRQHFGYLASCCPYYNPSHHHHHHRHHQREHIAKHSSDPFSILIHTYLLIPYYYVCPHAPHTHNISSQPYPAKRAGSVHIFGEKLCAIFLMRNLISTETRPIIAYLSANLDLEMFIYSWIILQ